jgi:hypothetical protein
MEAKLGKRKRTHELAVRTSISMPPTLWDAAASRQHARGFTSFSDYMQDLIRRDALTIHVTVNKP